MLLECLKSLIEEAYRVSGANYISIGYNKAYWVDNIEIGRTCISEHKFISTHSREWEMLPFPRAGHMLWSKNRSQGQLQQDLN